LLSYEHVLKFNAGQDAVSKSEVTEA
jgi:hypothetical protein